MSTASITRRNVSPAFQHDCDCCRFLGQLDGADLYICPRDGSLIRRFGNDGPDYGSLGDLAPAGTPYALAAKLARMSRAPHAYRTKTNASSPC